MCQNRLAYRKHGYAGKCVRPGEAFILTTATPCLVFTKMHMSVFDMKVIERTCFQRNLVYTMFSVNAR